MHVAFTDDKTYGIGFATAGAFIGRITEFKCNFWLGSLFEIPLSQLKKCGESWALVFSLFPANQRTLSAKFDRIIV